MTSPRDAVAAALPLTGSSKTSDPAERCYADARMTGGIWRIIITICIPMVLLGCEGQAELRLVSERLAGIPGVSVVRVWGNDDILHTGQVNADIRLGDGTPAMLFGIGRHSFEQPSSVFVAQIGRLSPWLASYGCDKNSRDARGRSLKKIGTSSALDLSLGSVIDGRQERRFTNVLDALSHQEELVRIVADFPRCPSYKEATGSDGWEYRYCVQECPNRLESCTSGPPDAPGWIDDAPCE